MELVSRVGLGIVGFFRVEMHGFILFLISYTYYFGIF